MLGHEICYSRDCAMSVGARNLKFGRKVALSGMINQNSSNLENVAMETVRLGNADFLAQFDHKGLMHWSKKLHT